MTLNKNLIVLALFSWAVAGPLPARAAEVRKLTFDDFKEGEMAPGFSSVSGRWAVKKEASVPGKTNSFLSQDQALADSNGYALAIFDGAGKVKDGAVQARLRLKPSGQNLSAGLIIKKHSPSHWLAAVASSAGNSISIQEVKNGKGKVIGQAEAKIEPAAWYRIQIFIREDRLACSLNGQRILQIKDSAVAGAGEVGFITLGDTQSDFDNLSVVKN